MEEYFLYYGIFDEETNIVGRGNIVIQTKDGESPDIGKEQNSILYSRYGIDTRKRVLIMNVNKL